MIYLGAGLIIALIIIIGVLSGKKANNNSFSGKHVASSGLVSGALIGTLVGGASTIGTAQLSFTYGLSAWWFTLGGAIGVLLLSFGFLKPMYNDDTITTLPDIITKEYGKNSGILVAVLSSIGTFLSFIAQILSGTALLMAVFPINFQISVLIILILMILYVFFGGVLALGKAGLAKTIILSISVLACGCLSCYYLKDTITDSSVFPTNQYYNLFARGIVVDAGAGLSLIVGVITTQSYISAVLSAKSLSKAKIGSIITAIIVPIIGIASIFVGMYMKANYPDINTKLAFPLFIVNELPSFVAGIILAALLIAVIGTGSGLAMGMASMLYKNIYKTIRKETKNEREAVIVQRIMLVIIALIGGLLCIANLGDLILNWSFLSMGLRGAVAFFPLVTALFFKGKISKLFIYISMVGSVLITIIGKFVLPKNIDPLFIGLGFSLIVLIIGLVVSSINKRKVSNEN